MVEWHHQLNEYEFEPTLGDTEGQGTLVCCSSWGHTESGTTEATQQQQQQNRISSSLKSFPLLALFQIFLPAQH